MCDQPFSVLLPTYAGDDPQHLRQALDSIIHQTCPPTEIVIVKDGPISDRLQETIDRYADIHSDLFRVIKVAENRGLGKALQVGVKHCQTPLIARMDADDLSVETRFEKQLDRFAQNPGLDVVGGYIGEFETDPDKIYALRTVPTVPDEIARTAKFRSPLNHGTVMFKQQSVLEAGNYREVDRMEDYDLWVRLLTCGARIENIPEVLVRVRAGKDLYDRRGGWEYAREEVRQQIDFLRMGFVSIPVCLFNLIVRVPTRLAPNRFRSWLYSSRLRTDVPDERGCQ